MEMKSARFPGTAPIDAYGNGGFRFAEMSHRGSIICLPDGIIAWDVASLDDISPAAFAPVFKAGPKPELFLFGMGERLKPISAGVRLAFLDHKIRIEAMDTGAAARTYNVLLLEGRSVAAGLLAVS